MSTWRPTKLQTSTVQKLQDAFKLGCSIWEACCYAEISRSSYYTWIEENPEFSDKIDIAKRYLEFKSRSVIANSLEAGDVKTAMWYLEKKNKKEFWTLNLEMHSNDFTPQKMIIEHVSWKYEDYDEDWNPPKK